MVIECKSVGAEQKIALDIASFVLKSKVKPIVLCVGCDRITGDSLAPMVGQMLIQKYNIATHVYGNLDYNVTAQNLYDTVKKVKLWHPNTPIIVVDGVLGSEEEIGQVKYYAGGCYPAGAYNKFCDKVGDYCVLGVVENSITTRTTFLASVRLNLVVELAHTIAHAVALGFEYGNMLKNVHL